LRIAVPVRIVRFVLRLTAKKLLSLLLLMALIAGGEGFASMAMPMPAGGPQMANMQKADVSCKACGGATMPASPCDTLCAALPAIDAAIPAPSGAGSHERWIVRSDDGATHFISPDTSPPRA
jgi:hypothetical protein